MIDYKKHNLLFGDPIVINKNVVIKVPTVGDIVYESKHSEHTTPLTTTTRELFSSLKEVDKYEKAFPNVWTMIFQAEGNLILGQLFGVESGMNIIIDSLAYWLNLDSEGFKPLSNSKIVNEEADLIIDESLFNEICNVVKDVTCHSYNRDLVAPRDMSDKKAAIWAKTYKGRMRNLQKNATTLVEKILILSVAMDNYIPLETIKNMTFFNFSKTLELISSKEAYTKKWDLTLSPKFETKQGDSSTHWQEQFKL